MDHDAALQQAGDQLGIELKVLDNLPGSDRASVVRVRTPDEKTYVLKSFDPASAGEGWVREAAALATLRGRGMPIPTLVAAGSEPPWVLMSDLGTGPNLATALLTADPIEAQRALLDWALAVGRVHSGSASARELFSNNLDQRCGDLPAAVDTTEIFLADTADAFTSILPGLGISSSASALAELRAVNRHLGSEHALSPADTCPDNNTRTPDGMKLLDFEGTTFRHIAWDAAYLTVPWPSCWCSWALPAAVSESAVSTWRAAVSATFPSAATPDFDAKLEITRTAWAFVSAS